LHKRDVPVIGLDVGGIASDRGQQSSTQQSYLKFATMIDGKRKMGYQAIGLGVDDLQFPADELLAAVAGVNGQPSLFISANVDLLNLGVFEPMRIIDKGGMKIGVTAVLGKEYQKEIRDPEIQMTDPDVALAKIVPELKKNADFLVLLANATAQESIALGKKFPEFNMVVTADSPPIPPREPKKIDGAKTWLIEVGHKGTDAIVIGLIDDPKEPCRYQRVPLDARFSASPDMKLLMAGYQEQLKGLGFAGLGLHAVQHPLEATSGEFVGSRKCESCHEISYDIWKKSGHSRAYATLVNLDPPRHFDPECISCHVIGWHPTKFFPYEGGFESMEKTPHLANTGCEDCHGPGEKHVAFELSGTESQKLEFRKAMVITKEESEKQQCATCHDLENSPNFDFKSYWPLIEHKEQVEE
jgi:hypothetical protein